MKQIHFDYETRSRADLKKVGAFRYSADPTTLPLCAAVRLNNDPPELWVHPKFEGVGGARTSPRCREILEMMADPDAVIYAHNALFEIAITDRHFEKVLGYLKPQHNQWRCTAAMARRAALPASLDALSDMLALSNKKDPAGKSLIRKFSIPQAAGKKKGQFIEPHEQPEAFKAFCDYCLQDVRAESEVHEKLSPFELTGLQLEVFQLDIAINTRGLTVNMAALENCQRLIDEVSIKVNEKFRAITGLNHAQNKELLKWLKERGYDRENLTADTLDDVLEDADFDPTTEVGQALTWKKKIGYASIKKIKSMLACVIPELGRILGCLLFYGAGTGRWSSVLVQFQNLKRPSESMKKISESAYKAICNGITADMLEWFYGEPLEVISSCIRHFIHDVIHGKLFDADYSAIEARIVNWLSGQEDAVAEFAANIDRYCKMASVIYGFPVNKKDHEFPWRFVGKQATLGCGFQMGGDKFRATCLKYGYELPEGLEFTAVAAFRETHPMVAKMWWVIDDAAKNALKYPGKVFAAGKYLKLFSGQVAGINYLFLKLPSGRNLAYAHAKLDPCLTYTRHGKMVKVWCPSTLEVANAKEKDKKARLGEGIRYWSTLPMKTGQWGWVDTYGGKLLENATQAVAADLMGYGGIVAERHGYQIATLIHDQALAYVLPGQTIEEFVRHLTTLPGWAAGLPLASEGKVVEFYSK